MNYFLIGVSEQAPITTFEQNGNFFLATVKNPSQVASLYFTLLQPLEANVAAGLFYSVSPYESMEYLTVVANESPSQIISTGFAVNPAVAHAPEMKLVM